MVYKKFDILLINFPFSDLSNSKKRPCCVISEIGGDNTIVSQISTKKRDFTKYSIFIEKKHCQGNIKFDSFVYVDMIFTIHKSIIVKKIGEIKNKFEQNSINKKLKLVFN